MPFPVRRPGFLSGVASGPEPRLAAFPHASHPPGTSTGLARGAKRAAPAAEPERPGAAEIAAIRAEAMERVGHAVEVLRLQAERLSEQARADALEIGFQVARHLLEAELQTGPEPLFALVRSALRRVAEARRCTIRLHPEDAAVVSAASATGELGTSALTIEVVDDPGLARGDCVVETDFGRVDGRLQTRFEELHRAAVAALDEGAA